MSALPPNPMPPKPTPRAPRVSLWAYLRLFRRDILSAQPQRLYHAWMAEFRTLFFRSYMINDPALIARVLRDAPDLFPKSNRIREGLAPLLGNSIDKFSVNFLVVNDKNIQLCNRRRAFFRNRG